MSVYMIQASFDLHINFNFDFLALYKIYFQKLLCHKLIYNIRVLVVSDIQLSPSAQVCISDTTRPFML